jgi:hypothetical protein
MLKIYCPKNKLMGLKEFYQNLKEKVKNFFGINRGYLEDLTEEQRNYILSGINPEILRDYSIVYSPRNIYFKADKNGTKINKGLEYKALTLDPNPSKRDIKQIFNERMERIKLDHLKKLNEIYSSIVETYNKGMDYLRDIFVQNKSDGSVIINFG